MHFSKENITDLKNNVIQRKIINSRIVVKKAKILGTSLLSPVNSQASD
jgi:hypothetical protein